MYKNRNMKGGNATSHSAEFYGKDSGSYSENPPAAGGSAYGEIRPVSHGTIVGNETGPNLAVYPGGGHIQTGGAGCGARRNQDGGAGCGVRRNQDGAGRKNRTRKNKKRAKGKSKSKRRAAKKMSRKNKKSRSVRRQ